VGLSFERPVLAVPNVGLGHVAALVDVQPVH
jgi:hypothetical protein